VSASGTHIFFTSVYPNTLFGSKCYCAMHYSAKRGLAIACRPSVCLKRWCMDIVDSDHTGWKSGKLILRSNSLRYLLIAHTDPNMGDLVQREHLAKSMK